MLRTEVNPEDVGSVFSPRTPQSTSTVDVCYHTGYILEIMTEWERKE